MSGPVVAHLQDCWNQTGVWGDASCPRLCETIHCRNCPVYANAAAGMLHGEPPADYLQEWTGRLATPPDAPEAARTAPAMIFRLGAEWLALPAAVLQEVAEPRPVHSLPHRRGGLLLGLANVRGELLICVSLGALLGIPMDGSAPGSALVAGGKNGTVYERFVVVATEGGRLVFPVSEVHGIERFAPENLQPVPATLGLVSSRYTRGLVPWRGHSVGWLDDGLLFHSLNTSLG